MECPPHHRAELVEGAHLVNPLRHGAGEPDEIAGEERVVDDVAPVLLAGGHHEWRAVRDGIGEVADRVAQARRRVQVQERRAAGGLRVAVGHRHSGRLLEGEHILETLASRTG